MQKSYFHDKEFNSIDFSEKPIELGEYENCTFKNCVLAEANLSNFNFEECLFIECDLSNAKLLNTTIQNVEFENCKLMGLQFDACNPFLLSFRFTRCQLNLSNFYQLKIKNTFFNDCILHEVDFTKTNLSGSIFTNCDFTGTMFGNTNLEKTDFRTSINFSIDPELNRIKNAKFSLLGIAGLLDKYDIEIG